MSEASSKVLLVTGASRGIGAAISRVAAARGWKVMINFASNEGAARTLVDAIRGEGGEAECHQADVSRESDIIRLFEATEQRFGRIDGLVNNAGIVGAKARLDEMTAERIQGMFAINTIGALLCAREAVRRMSTKHGGRGGAIVTVSSMAAVIGGASEYVDYGASKGALDTFTVGLAREVATEGIRVNAVRPGIIDTEIHASGGQPDRVAAMRPVLPMKREGTADEVALAVMFLLSEEASYINGAILNVSGGR